MTSEVAFVRYLLTIKEKNSPEWMAGLVKHINEWAESVGERGRVCQIGDGIMVLRPGSKKPEEPTE